MNVSRTIVGADPLQVQARARFTDRGVDDELSGTLYFEGGVVAQIACSLSQERRESVDIAGTDGWMRLHSAFLPGTGPATIDVHRGRTERDSVVVPGADQYQLMVEHFGDCVRGEATMRYPATEAARNLAVIEALYASARADGRITDVAR